MKTLYLAGPDVFAPDPVSLGRAKEEICARHGLRGVFPMGVTPLDPAWPQRRKAMAVYDGLIGAMRDCDGAIVNMTPFAGLSMDVGTAFEAGFFAAQGKPVFGYSNTAATLVERARRFWGEKLVQDAAGFWRGPDGMEVDALGETDNLMVDGVIARSTGVYVALDVPEAERFAALGAFERCVGRAADWFRLHAPEASPLSSLL